MMARTCLDCPATIAPAHTGRPPQRCPSCAGRHKREQDAARQARRPAFKNRIRWTFFKCAILSHINLFKFTIEEVSETTGVPVLAIEHAIAGRSITPEHFRALCKWRGWPQATFYPKNARTRQL